jgi:hypothetical protein
MEEQLQQIKATLLNSEHTFPHLQELLVRSGELRAWFKYYNGPNQWVKRFYQEENVFLMDKVIIVACLYANGKLTLRSIKLDEISRIERDYDFASKNSKDLVLSNVTILLKRTINKKNPDALVFKRPLAEEQGDPKGFEKLTDLLD